MTEDITKKVTGEAVKANPTHSTLDAIDHETDLEFERQKRKDSEIQVFNVANAKRKMGTDDGNKQSQDVSNEYPFEEAEKQKD